MSFAAGVGSRWEAGSSASEREEASVVCGRLVVNAVQFGHWTRGGGGRAVQCPARRGRVRSRRVSGFWGSLRILVTCVKGMSRNIQVMSTPPQ
ncbi:unnamed protein product [Lampetra planeri]